MSRQVCNSQIQEGRKAIHPPEPGTTPGLCCQGWDELSVKYGPGLRTLSEVRCLPSMQEALDFIPTTT